MTEPKKTAKKTAKKAVKKTVKKTAAKKAVPKRPEVKPLDAEPSTEAGFPDSFKGYPQVVEGVREITQNPAFDPTIDNEEDFA
jgi:hypothetical protein